MASTAVETEWKEDQMARLSDERRQRNRKIIDEERRVQGQERILAKHLDRFERNDFCDFDKPRKHACQKGKIESNKRSKKRVQLK